MDSDRTLDAGHGTTSAVARCIAAKHHIVLASNEDRSSQDLSGQDIPYLGHRPGRFLASQYSTDEASSPFA